MDSEGPPTLSSPRGMGLMLQQLGPEAKLKPVKVGEKVIQQRLLKYYTDGAKVPSIFF